MALARSAGAALRKAIAESHPLQIMGAPTAYAAQMAERIGYKALYLSGGGVALHSLGMPDLAVTTLSDVVEDARRITRVVDGRRTPLLVDVDTGFGGALSIARTIKDMEAIGVGGVHIEDQVAIKRCGHRPNKQVVPPMEMVARLQAACDARSDPDFFIMARTDAVGVEGMEAAIQRAKLYVEEGGADAIFAEALTSLDDYKKFSDALPGVHVLANMTEFGKSPLHSTKELADAGCSMVLYPLSAFRAMSRAAEEAYTRILDEGTNAGTLEIMHTREETYAVIDYHKHEAVVDAAAARAKDRTTSCRAPAGSAAPHCCPSAPLRCLAPGGPWAVAARPMADASETGACRMWLDCDPGHDDAMALLLACYSDGVELLGVSAVAGNQTVQKTTRNALRVLHAAGRPDVRVWAGATKPLLRPPFNCPEIHGESGLCGAELSEPDKDAEPGHAIIAMEAAITRAYEQSGGEPVQLVATGMLTNVALLLSVYPHVAPMVDVSIMGGAHTGGNTGVTQEFNIQCDPEAAKVVFDAPVRSLFMVPLEVTHTALATPSVLRQLHGGADEPKTPFRKAVHDLLLFFADTYQTVFEFDDPPLHDPLAVLWVLRKDLFTTRRWYVEVDTSANPLTAGQTCVDKLGVLSKPPNCTVATRVDVGAFWEIMAECVARADAASPMNVQP
eukprot:PRCOL_00001770-RA